MRGENWISMRENRGKLLLLAEQFYWNTMYIKITGCDHLFESWRNLGDRILVK